MAWTTQLDALLGGSQIAVSSFNTATVEFTAGGEGDIGLLALGQSLDGTTYTGSGYYPDAFDFNLGTLNQMDAVAAYAGTARIDGGIANPTFGQMIDNPNYDPNVEGSLAQIEDTDQFLSSVQQAAASLNTLRVTSPVDVQLELSAQGFDVAGFSGREGYGYSDDYDQNFTISAFNDALAFSPRPTATLNDPSIANLDQVAAISLNTMSFGTAATDEAAAGSENYSVLVDTNNTFANNVSLTGGGEAQLAGFNDTHGEVALGNTMVATTIPEAYLDLGGQLDSPYFEQRDHSIGDVALSDVSQVAALTANSIRQNGTGDLTLQAGYFYGLSGEFDGAFYKDDFVQATTGLDMEAGAYYAEAGGAVNGAIAVTEQGNVDVSNLSQAGQFAFNSIASGGDINGWNEAGGAAIVQTSEGSDPWLHFEYLNAVSGSTVDGDVTASGLDQVSQITFNTASAAGDLNANLVQENDFELGAFDDLNNLWLATYDEGSIDASGLSQIASIRLNSTSVDGAVTSGSLVQGSPDLANIYFDEGINDLNAESDYGNVSVDGIDQVAQLSINTLSAGSIDTASGIDSGIGQYASGLGGYGPDNGYVGDVVNEIDVAADYAGNASLDNATQTYVLNMNTVSSAGSVSGDVEQVVAYADLETWGPQNSTYVYANQDMAGLRGVGGNASIDGLVQTLASNVNTFSAASLDGANITQDLGALYSPLGNYAYVDAEWGAASADGIVQTAINRANYMSITTPK